MIDPVIVVGTGRSGTSVVARICQGLGVDMGGPGDTDRESNPGGDYERADVKEVNAAFHAGEITAAQYGTALYGIASEQDGPWGFKHPLASQFLEYLISNFPAGHYIWCQRDLQDTAESFAKWYGRDVESCMNTVKRRDRKLQACLSNRRNTLKIDMTNRWDEDDLRELVESYLSDRGVL